MTDDGIPEVFANGEVRKTLIDYYKWIVSLAVLIMTISLSLIALIGQDLRYKLLVLVGWCLLVVCIFIDWLLIKRLVTLPIVMQTPEVGRDRQHKLFVSTLGHMKIFGLIQNLAECVNSHWPQLIDISGPTPGLLPPQWGREKERRFAGTRRPDTTSVIY